MSTEAAPAVAVPVENGAVPAAPVDQPGHKVFAGNLAYSTDDEGLKAFFAPVAADILSTQIIYRGHRSAGYGFVAFNTLEAAQKAADLLNKKELDGRAVIVEIAKPAEEKQKERSERKFTKKRVSKKVRPAAAAADAVAPAKEDAGEASATERTEGEARPKKKRTTRKTKKIKAAASSTEDDATAALPDDAPVTSTAPRERKERKPRAPRPPKLARAPGETPAGEPSKTMLFVANLGFTVDDAALSNLFTEAGITVNSARVVRRRWGQPRRSNGYGFVDVGSEEEQKKAIETLQGKGVGGREIVIKIAVDAEVKKADETKAAATPTDGPIAIATPV